MFDGEHLSGPAEAGGDFIVDEQDAVFIAEPAQTAQVFCRIDAHTRCTLQNRFDDEGRCFLPVGCKGFFGADEAFAVTGFPRPAVGTAVAIETVEVDILHHHRLVDAGVEVHTADGEGADCFTVVRFGQAHEALPLRLARLVLILEGHLQGTFDGRRTVVREIEMLQPFRQEGQQGLTEFDGRTVGEIGEDDVF